MPAATLAELYDLERPLEQAWKQVLRSNGLPIGFTQREAVDLPVPRIDIQAALGAATGHRKAFLTGSAYLDAWSCRLSLQIVTQRQADAGALTEEDAIARPALPEDLHNRIRAKVRLLAQYAQDKFTAAVLPYHVLTKIVEAGTAPSVLTEDDCDVSVVSFDCLVSIRADAWPADTDALGTPAGSVIDLGGGVILQL